MSSKVGYKWMGANLKESLRPFKQAEKDLKAAKNGLQSAEKALKSILYAK